MGKTKRMSNDEAAEVPISSMIDVVFLLIIFFVVTANIDKDVEDEKVMLAESPHGRKVVKKDPRSVIINVHNDGVMTMGMKTVDKKTITKILKQLQKDGKNAEIPVIIRGDYRARHHYIKEAMDAVTDTGLYSVKLNAFKEE